MERLPLASEAAIAPTTAASISSLRTVENRMDSDIAKDSTPAAIYKWTAQSFQLGRSDVQADGDVPRHSVKPWTRTGAQIAVDLQTPRVGAKPGSYFLRGPIESHRKDANMPFAELIILDGDSTLVDGKKVDGAPDPALVHEALKDLGIGHLIYTSHSHAEGFNRYRVLVFERLDSSAELPVAVDWLVDRLQERGVALYNAKENKTWSQPWFFSRVKSEAAPFRFYMYEGPTRIDVKSLVARAAVELPKAATTGEPGTIDESTPIGAFTAAHNSEAAMTAMLTARGYQPAGNAVVEGKPAVRFLSPVSTTGAAGTLLFQNRSGVWCVYAHGSSDPLCREGTDGKRHASDPFTVMRILECGGDMDAAMAVARKHMDRDEDQLNAILEAKLEESQSGERNDWLAKAFYRMVMESQRCPETSKVQILKRVAKAVGLTQKDLAGINRPKRSIKGAVPGYAQEVIDLYGRDSMVWASGGLWSWCSGGYWKPTDEAYACKLIQDTLPADLVDRKMIGDVLASLKYSLVLGPDSKMSAKTGDFVNCCNGEVYLDDDGAWKLRSHDRARLLKSALPVAYDPAATAPRFLRYLDEIFEGDSDADEKKRLLQQMTGYTFLMDCRFETLIMLTGGGSNGKSVYLRILQALVGAGACSAVKDFSRSFTRAQMDGKMLNLVTEIGEGEVLDDGALKALASGETSTEEHKGKDPFEMQPYAKLWFATNHIPHTRDNSAGMARRVRMLAFNRSFENDPRKDPNLGAYLLKNELPGILNWALEGLTDAIASKGIVDPQSSLEAKQRWLLNCDQTGRFVEECCEVDPEGHAEKQAIWAAYQGWARNEFHSMAKALGRNKFYEKLKDLGYEAKQLVEEGRPRVFVGIRLEKTMGV